jgi:predicted Zn finger-like uncharacterized protein
MNVQCERCGTEYDFDDALVSGRGTTVKCTNCGYQFKLRPSQSPSSVEERWTVTSQAGKARVFVSLKELQRAILSRDVAREDVLTRGDAPPRPLSSIAELVPFFDKGSMPPPVPDRKSLPAIQSPAGTGTLRPRSPELTLPKRSNTLIDSVPPPPIKPRIDTLRPKAESSLPPVPALTRPVEPSPEKNSPTRTLGGMAPLTSDDAPPPPTMPLRESIPDSDEQEMNNAMRAAMDPYDDEVRGIPGRGRRRRVGGWVVAACLLGGVAVMAAVVARPYLANGAKAQEIAPLDPRAAQFLSDGERAFESGNLDGAKESFDKASAIAETNPRVLIDVARVSAARADVPWLAQRLLREDADAEMRATKQRLAELSAIATATADHALAAAPNDPTAVRAKLDALRIAGDLTAARAMVGRVIANAGQPETAYVLASLDLAEPAPLWRTVIDRLRAAASGELNGGRARAMLVYALVRSGDVVGAKAELDKLAALPHPNENIVLLRAFVDQTPAKGGIDGGIAFTAPLSLDVRSLPKGGALPIAPNSNAAGGGAAGGGGDAKSFTAQGEAAMRKGEYDLAGKLYSQALDRDPSDSEALGGLGDVARARHDSSGAIASYRRAMAINAMYLPAYMGLADVAYESGDHATAQKTYKEIVDRFPEGTYPPRVKERAESAPAPAPTEAPTAAPTTTAAIPTPTPTSTPTSTPTPTATADPVATAPAKSAAPSEPPPPKFEPPPL